jgi:hypothetical protein
VICDDLLDGCRCLATCLEPRMTPSSCSSPRQYLSPPYASAKMTIHIAAAMVVIGGQDVLRLDLNLLKYV